MLNNGIPVRLRGESQIHFDLVLRYRVIEEIGTSAPWQVVTIGYYYTLLDADQREILAFHWHPSSRSPITEPHLHLGPGARVGYDRLHRAHIPTGHITIQDVLLLAINDLGVEPLIDRDAALQTLVETRE